MVMTPQLQQAIKLLQLSRLELVDEINVELEENPVLEMTPVSEEEDAERQGSQREEVLPVPDDFTEVRVKENLREDMDWEAFLGEYSSSPTQPNMYEAYSETPSYENFVSAKTSLSDHLYSQWCMTDLSPQEKEIGVQIIGNLNDDGYLKASIDEVAALENCPGDLVESVLTQIQDLDPPGIAARDLRECLLIQLSYAGMGESLAAQVVKDHLHEIEIKNYPKIARSLKVSLNEIYEAERVILHLEPRPGRQFNSEEAQYISPDVFVYKIGEEYVIVLNDDGLPRLRVSQYYKDMLGHGNQSSAQAKDYLQGKLRSAMWLIRSIHQRQRTIYRVTESIFKFQKDFLDKGVEYLKPLVLRDVAEDVELHESTISRVTTNKYVHTPQGLFELKYFFDSPINRFHGESMASESVKKRIKQIITAEDPKKPLSDQRIVEILTGANIDIARRTVAKYREMLGIPPSSKRRKYY